MIRFFTSHPTAANLLMAVFVVLGLITLPSIKRETFPEIKTYSVDITIVYAGAAPADIEREICLPLEDALDGISFVEEKVCNARQNMGVMTVKMLESGDFSQFFNDVQTAVDGIDDFPDSAETPIITEVGRTQDVIAVALTASLPRNELKTLAEQLKLRMLQDPLIPIVEIEGFSDRQLRVEIPAYQLRRYGISVQDVASLIQSQALDLPLGSVETHHQEIQVRFQDERKSVDALAALTLFSGESGNEVHLGDIATIKDTFELAEDKISYNGSPSALLKIKKNTIDDSLDVLAAVKEIVEKENARLPQGITLSLTQDSTSLVADRISMLSTNAWQGLLLVFAVMWLFFNIRYAFWVVMGLPVSFLMSFFILSHLGITINMLSMVALLLALGILMDDAIVIAESIAHQIKRGHKPLQAAIEGTLVVARGVASSFVTTLCIFFGLIFLEGDLGQILKVIPIVLISVISVSLIEAFFILPNHLYHSLSHVHSAKVSDFRQNFEKKFEAFRQKVMGLVETCVKYRYAFVGSILALFALSASMLASGILKFSAFPNIEGDLLEARLLMPAGTPLGQTEKTAQQILAALRRTNSKLGENENQTLVKAITLTYNKNADAYETGPHLATISADLLSAEVRNTPIQTIINTWRTEIGTIASASNISIKEPALGPSGRAIQIRLSGEDFTQLSEAANELKTWLAGYTGVSNLLSDLRPGKPEFSLTLKPGARYLGISALDIANQTRAAFQGSEVLETFVGLDSYEVTVKLADESRNEFVDFDTFPIVHPASGKLIPLSTLADIEWSRGYSRIGRVNNQRTVTVYGDVDATQNNTSAILSDVQAHWLTSFNQTHPNIKVSFEGEVKNGAITKGSMLRAFMLGLIGVFILLSFQFKSYVEPIIVMIAIPLALIGVIWGHIIMGLDFSMPSMLGFVSLAGIVVNDSILLVEFVKRRVSEGLTVHEAAAKASYDRFRAVFLTSVTTIAGMTPLMFETSVQAQVLIPLATSIVFGIAASTLLVLFVIPCLYTILEDGIVGKQTVKT